MWKKIVLTFLTLAGVSCSDDGPTVTTDLITVRGRYKTSFEGRRYEAYEGIPYSLPPTGNRRFEPPQPITEKYDKTIDATQDPPFCIQFDYESRLILGQEDCLYLNVYTPAKEKTDRLPVLFWIHEGGYQRGAGNYTKAKYIVDRNVILVTINYRLGVYGFLSSEDEIVPGNMGLKDQNLALKWVSQNIQYFGGDPKQISLLGASVGGSSVQYHYLSKMSAGLFKNGISFSGTALAASWAFNPKPLDTAKYLADMTDCPTETTREMIECFRRMDAMRLTEAMRDHQDQATNTLFYVPIFMPVAEKTTANYFINQTPEQILRSGDIYDAPWITGVVSEEGAATAAGLLLDQAALTYLDEHWELKTPYTQIFNDSLPMSEHPEILTTARKHYIGDDRAFKVGDDKTTWGLIYMLTHESFHLSFELAARLQALANKSPVYAYYYTYKAAQSNSDHLSKSNVNFGVSHLDDISLVLENPYVDPTVRPSDTAMMKYLLNFWYTAMTTGKPDLGINWPKVEPKSKNFTFVHIYGPNNASLESNDNFGDKAFWKSVGYKLDV